jgi:hypothetical protein
MRNSSKPSIESASRYIHMVRGQKVVLDADLALLYGVETRRLNEQVRRNPGRFPSDFAFLLTQQEVNRLMSQFATSNNGRGGRRKAALAFTEHGALMAATILNSGRAVEISLYVVRAFVQLREAVRQDKDLSVRLEELERKAEALTLQQEELTAETRKQISEVLRAIRELMTPPAPPEKRPIGFVSQQTKYGAS